MNSFRNILCVVEPDDSSNAAVIQSIKLAQSHQAKLTIVSVLQNAGNFSGLNKTKATF